MKKLLLSILAAGSIAVANAQVGSWLVYGNVGYNSSTNASNDKTTTLNFNPGVGYQFNSMWTAGIAINMTNINNTPDVGTATKNNTLGIGVFARYTKPVNNIFSLYGQLDVMSLSNTNDATGTDVKTTGMHVGVWPAVAVHIPSWFELNFSFGGLTYETAKTDGAANTATMLDFTFGQTVNIGISKNFGCKKMHGHHEPGDETRHMNTKDDDDDAPKGKHKKSKSKSKSKSEDED